MSKNKNNNVVTRDGYEKFKKELEYLKGTGRAEAAEAISTASEQGDLSENAEYDAAKEAQAHLERRIYELEDFLKNCEIVEATSGDHVQVGQTIILTRLSNNNKYTVKLVGNNEANPFEDMFSVASPLGKEILGKNVHDIIGVYAPEGYIEFRIESISH